MSKKEKKELTPEEKLENRKSFNSMVIGCSLLYAAFGIIFIVLSIIAGTSGKSFIAFLALGSSLAILAISQIIWVLKRKELSTAETVILSILNFPAVLLWSFTC